MLHAQEFDEETVAGEKSIKGFDWDIRLGISFPFISNLKDYTEDKTIPFGSTLLALAFSSISLGGGFQYTIVPHLLVPGIYTDLHFNLLSWFIVEAFDNWEYNYMLLQPGIRLYNQFQFTKTAGIEPFFGVNYVYISLSDTFKKSIPLMNVGFVFKLGNMFGIEYCYNFSKKISKDAWIPRIHRINFSWSLRSRD